MKDGSFSPWFTAFKTPIAVSGATGHGARQEKETSLPSRVGSCTLHSHPSSSALSFSRHLPSYDVTADSSLRSSLVAVIPFSWEKKPGVPKHFHHRSNSKEQQRTPSYTKLPLPPPLKSNYDFAPRRKKSHAPITAWEDPFMLAMVQCSREVQHRRVEDEEPTTRFRWRGHGHLSAAPSLKAGAGRRRVAGARFGIVDLYGSCKMTCSVADSAVPVPRAGRGSAAYGILSRRQP